MTLSFQFLLAFLLCGSCSGEASIATCPDRHVLRLSRQQLTAGKEQLATIRVTNEGATDEYVSVWFNDTYQGAAQSMRQPLSAPTRRAVRNTAVPISQFNVNHLPASTSSYSLIIKLNNTDAQSSLQARARPSSVSATMSTIGDRCFQADHSVASEDEIWNRKITCVTPLRSNSMCNFHLKPWGDLDQSFYRVVIENCTQDEISARLLEYNDALGQLIETVEVVPHRTLAAVGVPSFNATWTPKDGGNFFQDPFYATSHTLVEAFQVWDWLSQYPIAESPTVMVVDTYTSLSHPEIAANFVQIPDEVNGAAGVDDDGDGTVDNLRGLDGENMPVGDPKTGQSAHGTAVCAIIAGKPNNGMGGAGLTPNVRVLPCGAGDGYMSVGASNNCMKYAINNAKRLKIRVTNHSYGAAGAFGAEREAFRQLSAAGIMAVAATGNTEVDLTDPNNEMVYPFGYALEGPEFRSIIATPRIDLNGLPAPSGFGTGIVNFYMTGSFLVANHDPKVDTTSVAEGTSFSSPAGAALIAAMLTVNYKLEVDDILYILKMTTRPYAPVAAKCSWGGVGNFPAVMEAAAGSWFKRADFSPTMEDFIRVPAGKTVEVDFRVSLSEAQLKSNYHKGNVAIYIKDDDKLNGATKISSVPIELFLD